MHTPPHQTPHHLAGVCALAMMLLFGVDKALAVSSGDGPGGVGTTDGASQLELWAKADGLAQANNTPVVSWPDSSGNARTLASTNANARPVFVSNVLGGHPVVRFTADYFGSLALPSTSNELTVVAVLRPTATGAYHNIIDDEIGNRPMLWVDASNNYEFNFSNGGAVAPASGGYDILFAIKRNVGPQFSQLYRNGPNVTASGPNNFTVGANQTYDLFNRDDGQAFSGDVAELIVYSTALTNQEIASVGFYLQEKYGIVADFPPSYPTLRSYQQNSATYLINTAISPNGPIISGGQPASFSITPALPAGLVFDTVTGVISGSPTQVSTATTYTVTASSPGSPNSSVQVSIAVFTPTLVGYSRVPAYFTRGRIGRAISPVLLGGPVTGFSVSPSLPAGLTLDAQSGVISGTPPDAVATATYNVSATFNGYPSSTYALVLEVLEFSATLDLTEFMASNDTVLADGDGAYSDWIEIHNYGAVPIDLEGWSLTDSTSNLRKYVFEARTLLPGAYLLVFASGNEHTDPAGNPHTGFSLSTDGEYLALVQPDGATIVRQFAPQFPSQTANVSYGLVGTDLGYFTVPTPGAANGFFDSVAALVTATPRGRAFTGSLNVALSAALSGGAVVRYTTNGTTPAASSPIYSAEIAITANTRLRARVFQNGLNPGPEASEVYLRLGTGVDTFTSNLPIVFLHTDGAIAQANSPTLTGASALVIPTDPATGRAGAGTTPQFAGRSGLRIRGRSSQSFPQKQYKFETWDANGREVPAPLLGLQSESDWVLYAPYTDKSLVRNALAYRTWEMFGWPSLGTRFVEVFINSDNDSEFTYADDYAGIYMLVESATLERVGINGPQNASNPANITGGYITESGNADDQDFSTTGSGRSVAHRHRDPGVNQLNATQKTWIRDLISNFELALYSTTFMHPTTGFHYSAYTNVDSQVDYKLAREWSRNFDGGSTYHHVPRGGKLTMGPLWDYNWAFGNINYSEGGDTPAYRTDGWNRSFTANVNGWAPWWLRFEQDPDWWQSFVDRWTELRSGLLSDSAVNAFIDSLTVPLAQEAAARHFTKWPQLGMFTVISAPGWQTRTTYQSEVDYLKTWLRDRSAWIDTQFPLRVTFSPSPGEIASGSTVTLTAGGSQTIYYTTNGADPRASGGGVTPGALSVSSGGTVIVNSSTLLVARVKNGTSWGAAAIGGFVVGTAASGANLVLTEIMYHPANATVTELQSGPALSDDDFEYLELRNVGTMQIDLTGTFFSEGVQFTFPSGVTLAPGAHLVVAKNAAAFALRYGNSAAVAGQYTGNLDNDADTIVLRAANGAEIFRVHYSEAWTPAADGRGYSLVLRDPEVVPGNYSAASSWGLSGTSGGSPGAPTGGVVTDDFTLWQQRNFASSDLAILERCGPFGDPDLDGASNLLEWSLGTHPLDPSSRPLLDLDVTSSSVVLTFTRVRNPLDLTLSVEESPNQALWSVVPVSFQIISQMNATETVRAILPLTGSQRFFRLHVMKALH